MRRAFTLIELIITTIIIAVIVSLALPMFSDQSGGRLCRSTTSVMGGYSVCAGLDNCKSINPREDQISF